MNIQQFHSAVSSSELVEDLQVLDRLRTVEVLPLGEEDDTPLGWEMWPEA